MVEISSRDKRIANNTILLYGRMIIIMCISLYTSRVVLNVLGVEDFGIYSVVAGFVGMFGFLNSTLSSSMQRFYNYYLGKNGESGISQVYSNGFRVHVAIAALTLVLLESIGSWYINNVMVIPDDRLFSANVVFQAVALSMTCVILQIPYSGAILAYEKMNFYAGLSIVDSVLKLGIVVILPIIEHDKLIVYAILLSLISFFDLICNLLYAKHISEGLRLVNIGNHELLKEMLSFSGWNMVGTFAYELRGQGINMILNLFFGPIVNAARGIAFQVFSAVSAFSGNIVTSFRPQVVNSYAQGDNNRVLKLFYSESKVCFALMLFLSIPLIVEIDYILKIWLGGNIPENTSIFTILVLLDMLLGIFNYPVVQLAFAVGNIKKFQIANTLVNIFLLPVSFILLKIGFPAIAVFASSIIFTVINQAVCLKELSILYDIRIAQYLKEVILKSMVLMLLSFIIPVVLRVFLAEGFLRFTLVIISDFVFTTSFAYQILMTSKERIFFINMLKTKFS